MSGETNITKAIEILKQGGLVIFPTDTAFAISCRIDDVFAIRRLFTMRRRPDTQPTPVLVDSLAMAQRYVEPIPQIVIDHYIKPYWPGALTIVLPCLSDKVPNLVRGGTKTLGVRMPNHEIPQVLITGVGVPLLGPSANFHDGQTPFYFKDLDNDLINLVDYVIEGECTLHKPSTVLDCSLYPYHIIRQGAVEIKVH